MSEDTSMGGAATSPFAADDALAELNDLFSAEDDRIREAEQSTLTQNLAGFASCFPDWDLHPPVD